MVSGKLPENWADIKALMTEYLKTKPNDDGCETYASYRGHAAEQLKDFIRYVEGKEDIDEDKKEPTGHEFWTADHTGRWTW